MKLAQSQMSGGETFASRTKGGSMPVAFFITSIVLQFKVAEK